MGKRAFSPEGLQMKAEDYHGIAKYEKTNPDVSSVSLPSLNVYFNFEEAIRLSLAIQSCVLSLNRFNRATVAGKDMGMLLSLKTATGTVTVIEAPVEGSRKLAKA